MENKTSGSQLKRIVLFVGFALAVLFFMNLNNRITILYQKNIQRDKLRVEVYQLVQTDVSYKTQIAYATSDRAVEEWARAEGHWVKDGDIPIFLIPDENNQVLKPVESTPASQTVSNWDVWKLVLFGN